MSILKEFIAFLDANADHDVNFMDHNACVLAMFGKSREKPELIVQGGGYSYFVDRKQVDVFPSNFMWYTPYSTYGDVANKMRCECAFYGIDPETWGVSVGEMA